MTELTKLIDERIVAAETTARIHEGDDERFRDYEQVLRWLKLAVNAHEKIACYVGDHAQIVSENALTQIETQMKEEV